MDVGPFEDLRVPELEEKTELTWKVSQVVAGSWRMRKHEGREGPTRHVCLKTGPRNKHLNRLSIWEQPGL